MKTVAVIGASLAGLRAVESLRRQGHTGKIAWVGAEKHLPYDRPPLSKQVLEGKWETPRVFLPCDLEKLEVDLRLGRRATTLDERTVQLDDESRVEFDGLVIATGATARKLPKGGQLAGVHTLRTLEDATSLLAELEAGRRAVVVGAGFIGLEVASCCRARGLDVTVVESLPVPLAGAIGESLGEVVANLHRSNGVDLRCGVSVEGLEGTDRVTAVKLSDGSSIAADFVVVGIGVTPNTDWLKGSGVEVNDGVVCDATCQTTVSNIVAAGDVARWHHELFDESIRVEHWTNAAEQADAAVARLLGTDADSKPFVSVPYFWSDQFDTKIQMAGRYRAGDDVRILENADGRLVAIFGREGILTGAVTFNRAAKLIRYRRAIGERTPFDDAAS